ncbi:GNAT family N-acetyltransferase [Roseobacter sp. CCS2]|uniref:GNAT family N-acetyltransferase n=1 Tax=Roseobacter sp. CCS2 TaxID=391593 RepID=UPI0000F4043E|nr:GNAT family protein [Roseobacter sp. CCS2]EBA13978.1 acetyltransferase [Roseobacter sp. CCS2]
MQEIPYTNDVHDDGGQVTVRQLTPDDVTDTYLSWFSDPVVTEYLEARNLSRKDVVDYMVGGRESGLHVMHGIFAKDSDRHIGNVKIGPISWKHGTAGLVTFIGDRAYWGKGIGREAVRIGVQLAFENYGLRKLSDGVIEGNVGSLKAYCAAGFVVEATMRGQYLLNGQSRDRIVISCFNPKFFPQEC